MEFNNIDLAKYKAMVNDYILHKDVVMNENYTVEDVLIVGLRTLDREKQWQIKHGSTSQKIKLAERDSKIAELEAKLAEAGIKINEAEEADDEEADNEE